MEGFQPPTLIFTYIRKLFQRLEGTFPRPFERRQAVKRLKRAVGDQIARFLHDLGEIQVGEAYRAVDIKGLRVVIVLLTMLSLFYVFYCCCFF